MCLTLSLTAIIRRTMSESSQSGYDWDIKLAGEQTCAGRIAMRFVKIALLLAAIVAAAAALRPRYWRMKSNGIWKTSAWGSSEEAGYQAGLQAAGMNNVAPSYYARYPGPGQGGYAQNVYGGPVGKK